MPTESYQLALKVIPKVRDACPHLYQESHGKKGYHTFLCGSEYEYTADFRTILREVPPEWNMEADRDLPAWGKPITPPWLAIQLQRIALAEISQYVPEAKTMDSVMGSVIMTTDRNTHVMVGKAFQIVKKHVWGLPVSIKDEQLRFHNILTHCVKTSVDENVWKIICRNAGGLYGINERVAADALMHEKAYSDLNDIHPFLSRSWVPMIRDFVEKQTGHTAEYTIYAAQLRAALSTVGLQKSGIRSLHITAEKHPWMFRRFMLNIMAYSKKLKQDGANYSDLPLEDVTMLNYLNGRKPLIMGVTFKDFLSDAASQKDHYHTYNLRTETADMDDLAVMVYVRNALDSNDQIDGIGVDDWMKFTSMEKRGSLTQGYRSVVARLPHKKRKAAVLQWANNAQDRWHRQMQHILNQEDDLHDGLVHHRSNDNQKELKWSTLLPDFTEYKDDGWTVTELTCTRDIRLEGRAMHHCVYDSYYDRACHADGAHIFSVRNTQGKRVSTLQLVPVRHIRKTTGKKSAGLTYRIAQNHGPYNRNVSHKCNKVVIGFLTYVNKSLITHRPEDYHQTRCV